MKAILIMYEGEDSICYKVKMICLKLKGKFKKILFHSPCRLTMKFTYGTKFSLKERMDEVNDSCILGSKRNRGVGIWPTD